MRSPSKPLPIPVERALRKLGSDLCDARRRRRISTTVMAERASISRTTLNKIEKGDSGVALGLYASVLFVLGMADRLADLVDIRTDDVGLELADEHLPQRIRHPRKSRPGQGSSKVSGSDEPASGGTSGEGSDG